MLKRGFWLYVWRVETPDGEKLYVGRTGDSSTPNATSPYARMGQHLGHARNQNALRRRLAARGITPEDCMNFQFITHGPLYPEIAKAEGDAHHIRMAAHIPLRDIVAPMERALADDLHAAGYDVLNTVACKKPLDRALWRPVRQAFEVHFPRLGGLAPR